MMVEDLGPPLFQRPAESPDLSNVVLETFGDGLIDKDVCIVGVVDKVAVAD